ncbi:MAG: hypothetical protein PWQ88_1195 [Candidatus Methanomethylophilaceae archaeon]|nr:hypothetical protein [Candidatus Methanomethylophilaceae archaeon]MDI3542362.1 hypothetical protein [Candidatus Methanomethylophilaceae archaeon]
MIDEWFILLMIVLLAFIMPLILQGTKIPAVVGEIVAGLAVGFIFFIITCITGDTLLGEYPSVDFLAQIGFVFLMFLSGLELDFNQLENNGRNHYMKGLFCFAATLLIAYVLLRGLNSMLSTELDTVFLTIILSTTSLAVVLTVVREMKLSRHSLGQNIIINAVFADVGAMILLTIYAISVDIHSSDDLTLPLIAIGIFIFILVFFIVVYRIGNWAMWYFPTTMRKFFRSDDPHELGVRASLAIIFTFVAVSSVIENEALTVLGAFLAGAAISMLFRDPQLLGQKLNGIGYGFLIPVFFISIGINFGFEEILNFQTLILLPFLILITTVAKILPFLLISDRENIKLNLSQGVLMTGGLTLIIAGAEIGLGLGVIDDSIYGVLILMAVILAMITPTLFRFMYERLEKEETET